MVFRKNYQINEWTKWSDTIYLAFIDFKSAYSFNPNLLLANEHTFSQFDFLVNNIPGEKIKAIKEGNGVDLYAQIDEEVKLCGFICNNVEIDFAINDKIENKIFQLVYDSSPEFDNDNKIEPINVDENKLTNVLTSS